MNELPDIFTRGRHIARSPLPPRPTHNPFYPPPSLRHLPPFTLPVYINTIGGSTRSIAQENRDRWTPPGRVPLATPPSIDWPEDDERLASDVRHQMLFPRDLEKRARMKDLDGEKEALSRYLLHVSGQSLDARMGLMGTSSQGRLRFYVDLEEEILTDKGEVGREVKGLFMEAGQLERFRYLHLDQDGGTDELERILKMGWPVKGEEDPEVREEFKEIFERCREEREVGKRAFTEAHSADRKRLESMGIEYASDKAPTS